MSTTNKKQALGKGLSALLENVNTDITSKYDVDNTPANKGVSELSISQIEANPFQPRTDFEKEALLQLVESIKQHGIIQPVTVRKMGYDKYQLISGERRFKASQIAGQTTIPAYVRIANDQSMLEMALVENIQRHDLNPVEIAISFKRLLEECQLTQEALSEKVSKDRSTVANYLRLLKLPVEIQAALRDKRITMGHAKALVNIENKETQLQIFNRILIEELSVREVEDISRWQNKKPESVKKSSKKLFLPLSQTEQEIKSNLEGLFKTSVDFKRQVSGKGKIVINFTSNDELNRVLDLLDLSA
ncbi:MAG: ParB/RepB/Spo0J family partition protein [Bacteroidetes bacterium]|nr:ParB/RepB/Spo0J family partition protein [Bacteroidota bacterium]